MRLQKRNKLNKAITDSIGLIATEGVEVKVKMETSTIVQLGVLAAFIAILIGSMCWAIKKF